MLLQPFHHGRLHFQLQKIARNKYDISQLSYKDAQTFWKLTDYVEENIDTITKKVEQIGYSYSVTPFAIDKPVDMEFLSHALTMFFSVPIRLKHFYVYVDGGEEIRIQVRIFPSY